MWQYYFFHGHYHSEAGNVEFCEVIKVASHLDPTAAYTAIRKRVADVFQVEEKVLAFDQFQRIPFESLVQRPVG